MGTLSIASTTYSSFSGNKLWLMKEYLLVAPADSTNLWDVDPADIVDISGATRSFLSAES